MQKSYYAIIPANVRYDKDLTPNAKLLYGEITALCNEKGYCWATNHYFAELYGVSTVSISKWIKALVDKGYINSRVEYEKGNVITTKRFITLNNTLPLTKVKDPLKEKLKTPLKQKFKHNNTNNNIKFNIENMLG